MKEKTIYRTFHRQLQGGVSLVETTIALGILLIAMAGVMTITMVAMTTTENQGHLAARATEYAQDKMEQLISLAYGDGDLGTGTGTDTTVFPAPDTGGGGGGGFGRRREFRSQHSRSWLCGLSGPKWKSRFVYGQLVLHPRMAD